jgi:xanthine dehydrogenase accessory factor
VPVTSRLLEAIAREERAVLFTVIEGEAVGAHLLVLEGGERVGDGVPEEAAAQAETLIREHTNRVLELGETRVFAEVYGPPPRLLVYGAVDTAETLCAQAKMLGWHTIVADARGKFATRDRMPSADELIVAWPEEALAQVAPDHATAVVVLTHDDKFDIPALKAALATEAFYVGALGSRRNQERRRERLLEAGVDEADLERISGPCGLDLGAESQPETALSILAEAVALRNRRDGGRLKHAKQRIHVVADEAVGTAAPEAR